jgi:quercetin dioxygenase-like cupin family protein
MALTMLEKTAEKKDKSQWPADIAAELAREAKNPNPCVGSTLLSENERSRVWIIRLAPGERIGFHRHVLDYFWTAVSGGRARQHVHDGTTVEYTYQPGETRHETYGVGEFKVHDLENLSDREMVFMTVEFKDSANKPMTLPEACAPACRLAPAPRRFSGRRGPDPAVCWKQTVRRSVERAGGCYPRKTWWGRWTFRHLPVT